jgi:predicted enzyme related to lactoylglutathione lyase
MRMTSWWAAVAACGLLARTAAAGGGGAVVPHKPSLLVQLQVSDLERSIRFYTQDLGFTVTERRDDLQFVHLTWGVEGLQLGLAAGGDVPPSPGTVTLNLGVRGDVEDVRRALEGRGVVFKGPTVVIPGKVRLAEFRDPDGYRLRLAGEDRGRAR